MTSLIGANIQRYFDFCIERHKIFIKKQAGEPWPWTEDKILQTYKFTNVYRQLDVGTVWLTKNIIEPYANHPELFFNIASYRRYNYWPAAEVIGYIEDYSKQQKDIVKRLREYKASGGQIFTGAHMLNCQSGVDKITHVFEMVLPELWNKRNVIVNPFSHILQWEGDWPSLELCFNRMLTVNGFGPFLSYEVVSDLRWTRYLDQASDIMTWANPGPGAKRGIQRLMGLETSNEYGKVAPKDVRYRYPNNEEYIAVMRFLLKDSQSKLPDWMPAWELREVEHTLCEFDKWERARTGEGRPRSKYKYEIK